MVNFILNQTDSQGNYRPGTQETQRAQSPIGPKSKSIIKSPDKLDLGFGPFGLWFPWAQGPLNSRTLGFRSIVSSLGTNTKILNFEHSEN